MSALTALVLALLGTYPGVTEGDVDRLAVVAEAIADESAANPVFGTAEDTAIALVAVAKHESGLKEAVQRCRVRGDNGRSIGLYQLMSGRAWQDYTSGEICGNDFVQARLALAVLDRYRTRCEKCGPAFWFRGYAAGDPGLNTRAGRELYHGWLFERTRVKWLGQTQS